MEVLLKKTWEGFVPADEEALEALSKIKVGEVVKASIVKPRNVGFHRKFFAMARLVFDNQDQYDNFNVFLNIVVKTITGHVDTVIKEHNGKTYVAYVPKSISFAAMDQHEFEDFYWRALDGLCRRYMHDTDPDTVDQRVTELVGFA